MAVFTTKLYIDQTYDIEILNQKVNYFKDKQVERGTAIDEQWNEDYGNKTRRIWKEMFITERC